jgi:hypothetical protein
LELSALLPLLGLPSEFTFWKLSELFGFGERSHQLFGDQGAPRKTGENRCFPGSDVEESQLGRCGRRPIALVVTGEALPV